MKFTAVVLTHNESGNIAGCVRSLASAARVIVLDSGSTDGTREYIESLGGKVALFERPFASFADQRNFALDYLCEGGEWVLHLDADERLTRRLAREIAALRPSPREVAFNLAPLTYFHGRPIPRAAGYPVYQTRLVRAGSFHFIDLGHGQKAPPAVGPLRSLRSPYAHYPFSKGLDDWFERHNRYSTAEAAELESPKVVYTLRQALADPVARRQFLRRASALFPFRPHAVLATMLFLRGGVFEGREGRDYCRLYFLYEQMIALKRRDLRASRPEWQRPDHDVS